MTRRTWLELLVAGGSFLIGGIVGIPALLAGISPALRGARATSWRPVAALDEFSVGEVHETVVVGNRQVWPRSFEERSIFVWRISDRELVVFSRSCTDLGCTLDYEPGSACYFCPCHGGIFTQNGQRLAGPPKRPMHRYAHRIRNGMLEIDVASVPAHV